VSVVELVEFTQYMRHSPAQGRQGVLALPSHACPSPQMLVTTSEPPPKLPHTFFPGSLQTLGAPGIQMSGSHTNPLAHSPWK